MGGKISITYFGTSDFSAQVLEALAQNVNFKLVAVVTQPGRPVGRNQTISDSPVKTMAAKYGLPIFEPDTLKNFDINKLPATDLMVVYSYGLIIPQIILDLSQHGTLNIHPSILPKYRGPTPIQSALINGDTETGVSIMLLDAQMDHGPILEQIKAKIDPHDNTTSLTARLVNLAIPLLIKTIPLWVDKKITPHDQDHAAATYCRLFTRDDGKIDWSKTTPEIYNHYRGLTPWPGVWTTWNSKRLKLLSITPSFESGKPGVVSVTDNRIFIGTNAGSIEVAELQLEGKKAMTAETFLNGYKNFKGAVLGL